MEKCELLDRFFSLTKLLLRNDINFRIVVALSQREGLGLRELARTVGMSPKNLYKYLEELSEKNIVRSFHVSPRMKIYTLGDEYGFLRDLFRDYPPMLLAGGQP